MNISILQKNCIILIISIILLASILPILGSNATSKEIETQNQDEKNYYAVIAACSDYENDKLNIPKRPFSPISEKKLKCLYDSLIESDNWEEENIILLLNKNASRKNILSALDNMSKIVDSNDVFLFSWQGHGSEVFESTSYGPIDEEDGKDEIICPYDCYRHEGGYLLNYITDDELEACFDKINSSGMCLIFECCLSGGLVNSSRSEDIHLFSNDFREKLNNPDIGVSNINKNNRIIIMSTLPGYLGKASFINGFPLTNALSKAFKKETTDKDKNGFISVEEAFNWAKPRALSQSSFFWLANLGAIYIENVLQDKSYPAARAAIELFVSYLIVQSYCYKKSNHFIFNFPNIVDGYEGELLLVEK